MTDALFAVDTDTRRIRGLLIPFNELSSPNVSGTEPVMFSAGTVTLPADPSVVTLNEGHDQLEPRGRGVSFEETEEGIVGEFEIARTPEGDDLLASAAKTPRPRLSAELRGLVRKGQHAVTASLRGAGVVPVGAFQSAALFAALDPITEEQATDPAEEVKAAAREVLSSFQGDIEDLREALTPILAPANAADDPTDAEQAEAERKKEDMTAGAATVPAGLNRPAAPKKDETTADGLFAALIASKQGNPDALKPFAGGDALFAISNIQDSGPSGRTIGADTLVPQYVKELWSRRPYDRRYVGLINHDTLTSTKVSGWRWTTEPTVGDYAGNLAEVPSNAVDTEPVSTDAQRVAGGHKLDRKFYDFPDMGVIASYFRTQTENYARFTDQKALASIVAAATVQAPGTAPTGGVAVGLGAIVDGALGVIDTDNRPSFAIVSPELWRDIALSPKDTTLEFLNAGFGLEEGSVAGFKIVPGNVGTGKVIVGAKEAATFYELGGGAPIRVEGVDVHHGGIDAAVFGYWAFLLHNAAAIRSITIASA